MPSSISSIFTNTFVAWLLFYVYRMVVVAMQSITYVIPASQASAEWYISWSTIGSTSCAIVSGDF